LLRNQGRSFTTGLFAALILWFCFRCFWGDFLLADYRPMAVRARTFSQKYLAPVSPVVSSTICHSKFLVRYSIFLTVIPSIAKRCVAISFYFSVLYSLFDIRYSLRSFRAQPALSKVEVSNQLRPPATPRSKTPILKSPLLKTHILKSIIQKPSKFYLTIWHCHLLKKPHSQIPDSKNL